MRLIWQHAPLCKAFEIGPSDKVYMRRWYVIPRNRWLNIYLHHILQDDDDRALHDHPWVNLSLIISAGYREITFAWKPEQDCALPPLIMHRRRPWWPVIRRAHTAHRLFLNRNIDDMPIPAWSLFITGPNRRGWGFWCPHGRWVHWRDFTAGNHGEIIGKGCE